MKSTLLLLFLCLCLIGNCHATDIPELKAILARYDQTQFATNEPLREKFVLELAKLRWDLARGHRLGWTDIDTLLRKYPAPPNTAAYRKTLTGMWYTMRDAYIFNVDGTWTMHSGAGEEFSKHGTWSIDGNQYVENIADTPNIDGPNTIILLDDAHFIYCRGNYTGYQKRPGAGGYRVRRDDP